MKRPKDRVMVNLGIHFVGDVRKSQQRGLRSKGEEPGVSWGSRAK